MPEVMRLRAADLMIVDHDGGVMIYAASDDKTAARYLIPAVRNLVGSTALQFGSPGDGGPLALDDTDFFRWLLWRYQNSPKLSADLTVLHLRTLSVEDRLNRAVRFERGADEDRPEVLVVQAKETAVFGPAKFAIGHEALGLGIDLEYHADGRFRVTVGESAYDERIDDALEERRRLFEDAAFTVLPELLECYRRDSNWLAHDRSKSIADARSAIATALAQGLFS